MKKEEICKLVKSRTIVFTQQEIDAAEAEMRETKNPFSSIARHGFRIGLTLDPRRENWISAYVGNLWISHLNIKEDDGRGVLETISTPAVCFEAFGTPFEEEACRLAAKWSYYRWMPESANYLVMSIQKDINRLTARLESL